MSKNSSANYRAIFEQFDLNGDGSISRNELAVALRSAGVHVSDDEVHRMLKDVDCDASDCIDFDEFVKFLEGVSARRGQGTVADEGEETRLREIFDAAAAVTGFDLVGVEELRGCEGFTAEETATMASVAEALHDRSVDFDEFKILWRAAEAKK